MPPPVWLKVYDDEQRISNRKMKRCDKHLFFIERK